MNRRRNWIVTAYIAAAGFGIWITACGILALA